MTPDAQAVYASMRLSNSVRIVDLMDRTGLARPRVHAALNELKRNGVVGSFAMGSRFSLRRPSICPPAATPAHTSHLADDTHAGEGHPCGGGLSAVANTGTRT